MAANSGCRRRRDVPVGVADQKAGFPVDRPVFEQIEDHPRHRLAPIADLALGRVDTLGAEGAIAEIVDTRARRGQLEGEVPVCRAGIVFGIIPTRDTALMVTTRAKSPESLNALTASLALPIQRKRTIEPTYPSSWLRTPSRSRKTAGWSICR